MMSVMKFELIFSHCFVLLEAAVDQL